MVREHFDGEELAAMPLFIVSNVRVVVNVFFPHLMLPDRLKIAASTRSMFEFVPQGTNTLSASAQ